MSLNDVLGTFLGFILTLFIFSYIIGDNLLFRLAIHIFIGVSSAYTAVIVWYNVIWPQMISPLFFGQRNLLIILPFLLSILLLAKVFPPISIVGTPVMAYLVGVGAAAAVGGAVLGTIFPQLSASMNLFDMYSILQSGEDFWLRLINGGIILIGTITTLAYFQFGVRFSNNPNSVQMLWWRGTSWIGQVFIAITFGALFAGVFAAALTALVERLGFLVDLFSFVLPTSYHVNFPG